MKKFIYFNALYITALPTIAFANTVNFSQFIPKKFNLLEHHCQADLNKDDKKDCVLIIKDTKKSGWVNDPFKGMIDRNRRGIIILFKTDNGYQKILENKTLFASENEDGGVYFTPELYIETKNNKLLLKYGHGRYGHWSYTFDYRTINGKQDFYLIGYDLSSNMGPYVNYTYSVNFLTHKFRHQMNIDQERISEIPKLKTTWYDLPKQDLIKLSQIADLDELGYNLDKQLYELSDDNE
ncbi:MAG: hypothetical protein Q4B79_02445 [Moraxella sp.]|uniref:hypothetical protein n=1 Tax=Moraxella sp. TaxID=479 RepID=UPI0026DDC00C|nr:hypothetical protein [Moraxella sp.]MDO4449799.1 hypothetical protein [Moraxella sp.]